jgi:hypothetical protein
MYTNVKTALEKRATHSTTTQLYRIEVLPVCYGLLAAVWSGVGISYEACIIASLSTLIGLKNTGFTNILSSQNEGKGSCVLQKLKVILNNLLQKNL